MTEKKEETKHNRKKLTDYNCYYHAPDCGVCDARHLRRENSVGGVCEDTRLQFLIEQGVIR